MQCLRELNIPSEFNYDLMLEHVKGLIKEYQSNAKQIEVNVKRREDRKNNLENKKSK